MVSWTEEDIERSLFIKMCRDLDVTEIDRQVNIGVGVVDIVDFEQTNNVRNKDSKNYKPKEFYQKIKDIISEADEVQKALVENGYCTKKGDSDG